MISLDLFDAAPVRDWSSRAALEANAQLLGQSWVYQGEPVGAAVADWLLQFHEAGLVEQAVCLLRHLRREGYLTERMVISNIGRAYERLCQRLRIKPLIVALQPIGKSEGRLAYNLNNMKFLSLEAALRDAEVRKVGPTHIVCVDDFIGSGGSMIKFLFDLNPAADRLEELLKLGRLHLTAVVSHADENGIRAIREHARSHSAVTVEAAVVVDQSQRVFGDGSVILGASADRDRFRVFCEHVGRHVYPKHPLGWHDAQWCIVTDYSVPNMTLPVLFRSGTAAFNWIPIFPRNRGRQV